MNENSGLFYNSFVYFLDHPQYCSLRSILQCQSSKTSILILSCLSIFYFNKVFKEKHCLHNSELCMYEQVSASEYFLKAFITFLLSTSMWDVFRLLFPVLLTDNTKTLKLSTISISSLSVLKLIAVPYYIISTLISTLLIWCFLYLIMAPFLSALLDINHYCFFCIFSCKSNNCYMFYNLKREWIINALINN